MNVRSVMRGGAASSLQCREELSYLSTVSPCRVARRGSGRRICRIVRT